MNESPEDFQDLRRLLALKRHEEPPPGYFSYLPDKIMMRIEREELAEHSTWWAWLVERFDARPVLAGAYACAISGIMLLGFKVSQDLQAEAGTATLANSLDPANLQPSHGIRKQFANPGNFLSYSSTDPVLQEPAALSSTTFPAKASFVSFAH